MCHNEGVKGYTFYYILHYFGNFPGNREYYTKYSTKSQFFGSWDPYDVTYDVKTMQMISQPPKTLNKSLHNIPRYTGSWDSL